MIEKSACFGSIRGNSVNFGEGSAEIIALQKNLRSEIRQLFDRNYKLFMTRFTGSFDEMVVKEFLSEYFSRSVADKDVGLTLVVNGKRLVTVNEQLLTCVPEDFRSTPLPLKVTNHVSAGGARQRLFYMIQCCPTLIGYFPPNVKGSQDVLRYVEGIRREIINLGQDSLIE